MMYQLKLGKRTPLTAEELKYLRYPLDSVRPESPEVARRNCAFLKGLTRDE